MLVVLGIPLGWSLRGLIVENNVRYSVNQIVRNEVAAFNNSDIRLIEVSPSQEPILVEIEVAAEPNSLNRDRLSQVKQSLTEQLDKPVKLEVKVVPLETITLP